MITWLNGKSCKWNSYTVSSCKSCQDSFLLTSPSDGYLLSHWWDQLCDRRLMGGCCDSRLRFPLEPLSVYGAPTGQDQTQSSTISWSSRHHMAPTYADPSKNISQSGGWRRARKCTWMATRCLRWMNTIKGSRCQRLTQLSIRGDIDQRPWIALPYWIIYYLN